jgi:hypothetical protein
LDLKISFDLGWLRAVDVAESDRVPMNEESLQQAAVFEDPEFQRNWMKEQVEIF